MKFFKSKKGIIITSAIFVIIILLVVRHFINASVVYYKVPYEKQDIADVIRKDNLTDEDFMLIYKQTGISPGVAKELINDKNYEFLEEMNDLYFNEPNSEKIYIAWPVTLQETNTDRRTPLVPLKTGDILITFNTHTLDWRHGHAALVLDGNSNTLLEHMAIGQTSCVTNARSWGDYPAFAVLRYPDEKVSAQAAAYAQEHLIGLEYNILAGFFKKDKSDENKPSSSHCSHIVWQAYKAHGVDIDQNGGIFVTPKDIARSQKLKVVQIYGLNPKDYTSRILEN